MRHFRHTVLALRKIGNGTICHRVIRPEGTLKSQGLNMSAIGMSRGKGFKISAYAGYDHDHLVFARQQSHATRQLPWEDRVKPLKSWSSLLGPWLGLAGLAAIILPFVI